MNSIQANLHNNDGSIETLLITSSDNTCPLDITKTYRLANHKQTKENKITKAFKNSIFGVDIGIKSEGFTHITILSTIIAIGTLCIMYLFWRL